MIYGNCIIKGVYKDQTGRDVVHIYFPDGRRKVTSYARFLIEKKLNRELTKDETVDHIDRNFNNNNISNLQVLPKKTHASLDSKRVKDVVTNCVWCKKEFIISGKRIKDRQRGKTGVFCSNKCIGEYGAELQNNRIE